MPDAFIGLKKPPSSSCDALDSDSDLGDGPAPLDRSLYPVPESSHPLGAT